MAGSSSTPCGFVLAPLPGGIRADANTLEMNRLDIAAGESTTEPYTHLGAAIYFVLSGTINVTFSTESQTVLRFTAGVDDPGQVPPVAVCDSGCQLNAGDWFSFDSDLALSIGAGEDADATVLIVSLTPESEELLATLDTPTEARRVVITRDSGIARPL